MCILRLPSVQALRAFFGVGVADLKRIPHIAAFDATKSQLSERVQAAGNEVGFKSPFQANLRVSRPEEEAFLVRSLTGLLLLYLSLLIGNPLLLFSFCCVH